MYVLICYSSFEKCKQVVNSNLRIHVADNFESLKLKMQKIIYDIKQRCRETAEFHDCRFVCVLFKDDLIV
jgi:hypothetical protein